MGCYNISKRSFLNTIFLSRTFRTTSVLSCPPRSRKEIVWDVFKDVKKLSGDMVILLQAEKEPEKPVHWLYVVASMLFRHLQAAF
ncbi:hypothetical protein ACFL60_05930 [Candidatus Omnitrophota bacterium]